MKREKGHKGKQKRIDKNSILSVSQGRAEWSQNSHTKDSIAASSMTEDMLQAKAYSSSPRECSDGGTQTGESKKVPHFCQSAGRKPEMI